MIKILDKHKCCGCNACSQVCPVKCITMVEDAEGFLYPSVDENLCINCNRCNSVCPILNVPQYYTTSHYCYAAYAKDESVRYKSSSGGLFTVMSEEVLKKDGVVYGAAFDKDWSVHHIAVDKIDNICSLQGSKYMQSRIENAYKEISILLRKRRYVLFSGTPCQILGLRCFLGHRFEEYDNLITVEVVCHGVPSSKVWKDYLKTLTDNPMSISYVNMRDKSRGWSKYCYLIKSDAKVIYDDYAANSPYLKAFIGNYTLRPSCYDCVAKSNRSGADITIADCWGVSGIKNIVDDDKGISLVIANTNKGVALFSSLKNIFSIPIELESIVKSNPAYFKSSTEPKDRKYFWELYRDLGLIAIDKMPRKRLLGKIKELVKVAIIKSHL